MRVAQVEAAAGSVRGMTKYCHGPPATAEAEAKRCCSALLEAGVLPKLLRLAGGERTYLETARALYALRQMTATSADVCVAIGKAACGIDPLVAVASPGWWERLWEVADSQPLPRCVNRI